VTVVTAKVAAATAAVVTAVDTTAVAATATTAARFKRSEIQTHCFSIKPKNDSQCQVGIFFTRHLS